MNCFLCQVPFGTRSAYFDHLTIHHGTPTVFKYTCTACVPSASYQNLHRFKRHINTNHSGLFGSNVASGNDKTEANIEIEIPIHPGNEEYLDNTTRTASSNDMDTTANEEKEKTTLSDSDILDLRNKLREMFLNFTLDLHSKSNYTRKDVINLQQSITDQIVKPICDTLLRVAPIVDCNENIKELISDMYQPFQFIGTEQKFNTTLKDINLNDKLQVINYEDDEKNIVSKGCIMPIKYQFKQFFESGDVFSETMKHMSSLEKSNDITNVVNGTLWKNVKEEFPSKCVIPYFIYSDEVEMNDAIGAHSGTHKVTGIYYNFPTIPTQFLSRLENLFVAGFIKASDLSKLGPSQALKDLIDVFIDIEQNGIEFDINGNKICVYFVLMGILGDNLGINMLMGFATSFSSLFYCRFCTTDKYESQTNVRLDPNKNRNRDNYAVDIRKPFKESGIKEESAFNKLKHYHVAEFVCVDLMHDLYSHGVCNYDMSLVLSYMIKNLKISLKTINYRIQMFDCKETEKRNTFKTITKDQIKSTNFKMTAREMMFFVHYFPLIFGEIIPENDKVWNFVLSLVELVNVILLPRFNDEMLFILEEQIVYHHTLYREIFDEHLKPKYHILLHYAQTIRKIGPPRYIWSFRFEAFHQVFKKYCRNITSRRNICFTLCTKANLIFMHNIRNTNNFKDPLVYKNAVSLKLIDLPYFSTLNLTSQLLTSTFNATSTVTYKGTEYRVGQFLTKSNINMKVIELHQIKDLLITTNVLNVACQQWQIEEYSTHFASFKVNSAEPVFNLFHVDEFDGPPINVFDIQGNSYIRLKKYFK